MGYDAVIGLHLSSTGCWTCKDRRVRCDRQTPECQNCSQVRRKCQGYGMRLSWPRDNDYRRAILATPYLSRRKAFSKSRGIFIPTTFQDMEIYYHLSQLSYKNIPKQLNLLPDSLQTLYHPSGWKNHKQGLRETDLVQYFLSRGIFSISVFNQNATDFRDLLIQMALSDDTAPSRAVLYALLAVASLHRDGDQYRAIQFKISAINALAVSAHSGRLCTRDAAQHVAAGMLLCSFEIQILTETTGQWLWYLRGVKDVIKSNQLHKKMDKTYIALLVDWVFYHDVIAQFSVLHWRPGPAEATFTKKLNTDDQKFMLESSGPQLSVSTRPPHRVLQFLSDVFDVTSQVFAGRDDLEKTISSLNTLEGNASNITELSHRYGNGVIEAATNATNLVRLYQLAAAIYLFRVSDSISGEVRHIGPLLDDVFSLLSAIRTCELQFPILIMGFEARTDEQRIVILDLVRRTEKISYSRGLDCLRRSLKALWVQEDLFLSDDFVPNYIDRLSAIVSKTGFIPSLV